MPDTGGAPVPPRLCADGTNLRHLIPCVNRVPQTWVGGHRLEAAIGGGIATRRQRCICHLFAGMHLRCGTTHHHPKTVVVVTVMRVVVVAVRRTSVVRVVGPRPAAQVARLPQVGNTYLRQSYQKRRGLPREILAIAPRAIGGTPLPLRPPGTVISVQDEMGDDAPPPENR